jgi:hypothetical protein
MKFELIWHGPVRDVRYLVEADDEESAMELLLMYLNGDLDEDEVGIVEMIDEEIE